MKSVRSIGILFTWLEMERNVWMERMGACMNAFVSGFTNAVSCFN